MRDGYQYQIVEEVPSADTLIFDHDIAIKIWGKDHYKEVLCKLASVPIEERDQLLHSLYYGKRFPHVIEK